MQKNASLLKLFAASLYELILLIALWMLCAWLVLSVLGDATQGYKRLILQACLWLLTGAYFVWCWCRTGQTLAAKTWKIKLVNQHNTTLNEHQAVLRYALASASILAFGLGFAWALVDKQHLYLHDRLLKTRFVQLD